MCMFVSIYVYVYMYVFSNMLCIKIVYRRKKYRFTGQQSERKSACGFEDKARVNSESIAGQSLIFPLFGLHRVSFVRASRETLNQLFFDALGVQGTYVCDVCMYAYFPDMSCMKKVYKDK